jgi:hypothetical protein
MIGAMPPLPQYVFMAWWLVKAQGKLYLFFTLIELYTESDLQLFLYVGTQQM